MITYRRYMPGDEARVNQLYYTITGRVRTRQEFEWQWHGAPGGAAEIWLICDEVDGVEHVVGHHGIMPIRFTDGRKDLLFGKTENTMLLPEYRQRLIYPRFERRFKSAYESRFDALFSTFGPVAAIRTRTACGYRVAGVWRTYFMGVGALAEARAVFNWIGTRWKRLSTSRSRRRIGHVCGGAKRFLKAGFATEQELHGSGFFDSFWQKARVNVGIAPSRNREDLEWRFWRNPYKKYFTFVDMDGSTEGFAIISVTDPAGRVGIVEDVAVCDGSEVGYTSLLRSLLQACRRAGLLALVTQSTVEKNASSLTRALERCETLLFKTARHFQCDKIRPMLRCVTARGIARGVAHEGWCITPFILEGR